MNSHSREKERTENTEASEQQTKKISSYRIVPTTNITVLLHTVAEDKVSYGLNIEGREPNSISKIDESQMNMERRNEKKKEKKIIIIMFLVNTRFVSGKT